MTLVLSLTSAMVDRVDISSAEEKIRSIESHLLTTPITFEFDLPRDPSDPREWSEIPEVRLWFLRLDASFPHLLLAVDGKKEIYRYVAMFIPHQFHRVEGIEYNLEALELFVMNKLFVMNNWLQKQGISGQGKLKAFAQSFGYDLSDEFWNCL